MSDDIDLVPIDQLKEAANCLRLLAHPTRLRMVDILMQGEYPVHRIAEMCDLPPHQTCEHLRLLLGHGHLSSERRGRSVYYRIADTRLPELLRCMQLFAMDCSKSA